MELNDTADERKELLKWLYGLENFGIKLGLDNERLLLNRLGNPQEKLKTVHVAGTNGKGSVSAMIASVLSSEGYATGLYTSPHLVEFEERIKIGRECIPTPDLLECASEVREALDSLFGRDAREMTFFEITTAIAFLYFAKKKVEFAVIEVGLGGRLDATNVIVPEVSAITHIALEHTAYLGNTLGQIAAEKGGIIKNSVPVITAETKKEPLEVFERIANERGAVLEKSYEMIELDILERGFGEMKFNVTGISHIEEVSCALCGDYQVPNITLAIAVLEKLQQRGVFISTNSIRTGLKEVFWPGRLQLAGRDRKFIFDTAHNPDATEALSSSLSALTDRKFICVAGVLSDKDLGGVMRALSMITCKFICAAPQTPRARTAGEVTEAAASTGVMAVETESVGAAMEAALKEPGDGMVLVTGSLRTVGEAMEWWYEKYDEKLWK